MTMSHQKYQLFPLPPPDEYAPLTASVVKYGIETAIIVDQHGDLGTHGVGYEEAHVADI